MSKQNENKEVLCKEIISDFSKKLYDRIKHGDKEHKRWLREEIKKFTDEYLNSSE